MLQRMPIRAGVHLNAGRCLRLWFVFLFSTTLTAVASEPDLTMLSLADLMRVKVTSVSKKPEPWFEAPAAIYVITDDDIRRAGVTGLPEALRLAPGVQVGRFDAATWGVSTRGLNDLGADKLLVLIDGRSVYNQFYSGVVWDEQNLMLEDVDRIEVVRGPGGTLWGPTRSTA